MRLSVVIAILFAAVFCTPVYAESISLADLINNNGSITNGDKLFDEFTYLATGDMPPAEGVNIAPWTDAAGNFGIVIQGGFGDLYGNGYDDGSSDALLSFRVTALDQNKWISDAHIEGNPYAWGGSAIMQVVETFTPAEPNKIMAITTVANANGQASQLVDDVVFDTLYRSLLVQKDIYAYAKDPFSSASISFIYQSFSQVPEPTCVVFLLSGLALLCFRVRRVR